VALTGHGVGGANSRHPRVHVVGDEAKGNPKE